MAAVRRAPSAASLAAARTAAASFEHAGTPGILANRLLQSLASCRLTMAPSDVRMALLRAVREGNAAEVARLLGAGAVPNASDEQVTGVITGQLQLPELRGWSFWVPRWRACFS